MNTFKKLLIFSMILILSASCDQKGSKKENEQAQSKGKLFIIGGGKRSTSLVDRMIKEAGIEKEGYVLILPMASEEEDTAIFYGKKQFVDRGVKTVYSIRSAKDNNYSDSAYRLIENARLVYIPGGDQNRFMKAIQGTPIKKILNRIYFYGVTIAGTSAGAAVMSEKMISGNEIKHPKYTGNYTTIEANNIEITTGLGFLDHVIVDQHFIKRQRLNRLVTVCLENPESTCIGIDEATAIIVSGGMAEVVGDSQVIRIKHIQAETKVVNGLLGGKDLDLSIYLAGDKFEF